MASRPGQAAASPVITVLLLLTRASQTHATIMLRDIFAGAMVLETTLDSMAACR